LIPCRARPAGTDALELELEEPAEAAAPGQLACLMRDDCVVGEGTIRGPG
jgi:tRNA U34 2-thiouridine synthase MnmA/TrmU